ncbi:MAG: 2-dehydropantoate 2-reductase [Phycisphaerae bacterium SG8_4]|nr:MAG: 2-dehydropantoate 2-reductase [Phycisphaerae bacterium SG8_4]
MIVLIYGSGAVGLGLASCLLKAGVEVDLIDKEEDTVVSLREHGICRTGVFGDFSADPSGFHSHTSLRTLSKKEYNYILVCTKSFDSYTAAKDLADHKDLIGHEGRIVLCQNGWGNAEIFASVFEKERVYNARIITGFQKPNKHTVVITVHADSIRIGNLFDVSSSCIKPLCQSISDGGIPCEITAEIGRYLWAKMLYNCALNPLGALLDVPYGVLAEYEYSHYIMDNIVQEVFAVMTSAGYETQYQTPKAFLDVFYSRLVPDTAQHRSSMLQDIKAGKQTEIDALNGAVIELAKIHGLDVPYNCVAYNLVRFLELRNCMTI